MIDITSESLLQIGKAPLEIKRITGERPHRATIDRWRRRGCQGVKLETVKIGGKRYVSHEALQRFVEAVTAAADRELPRPLVQRSTHRRATKRTPAASIRARFHARKPSATDLRANIRVVLWVRFVLSVKVSGLSLRFLSSLLHFLARLRSLLWPACILACGFNDSISMSKSSNHGSADDKLTREPLVRVSSQPSTYRHGHHRPAGKATEAKK